MSNKCKHKSGQILCDYSLVGLVLDCFELTAESNTKAAKLRNVCVVNNCCITFTYL